MEPQGTCLEVALERLSDRAIKEVTYQNYLRTLRLLGLEQVPYEDVTVRYLTNVLNTVLHPGNRRKHAINLRASLGVKVPVSKAQGKDYDLPEVKEVQEAFSDSRYRVQVYSMLFAGLRLGEACVKQPVKGSVINVDRQRLTDMSIAAPKTAGPVYVPQWFAEEYEAHDEFDRHATSLSAGIRRRMVKTGINLNAHALRHMFATELVAAGAPPEVLRRQMRHHDVAVSLKFYVHTKPSDIEAVMRRFGQ